MSSHVGLSSKLIQISQNQPTENKTKREESKSERGSRMGVILAASTSYNISVISFSTSSSREKMRSGKIYSNDVSDTASTVEMPSSESEVVEAPKEKGPPSLISTLNVERALRGNAAITDIDYYGRLGLQRGCSYDQVPAAYKRKMEEWTNKGLDEEELNPNLEILKESYLILSNPEDRRLYDWSLLRSDNPDRYAWPFEADILKKTSDDPPPQEPEDFGPTRAVGYFMLGWLLLGFATSTALNR